ncbi:DNA polymerase ligase N-terminal domain-containing protein [Asanoa siamensis]|nr:DNA polymerase ligase N-terminal domain-containing protein [Asanoa siamensis]
MPDRLEEYRRKRDAGRTPEPVPEAAPAPATAAGDRFVIQQHHARALHWDLRLERDGVLVSWAVPRGLPRDQVRNHLAVHTEDHPMEYLTFHGDIPAGEYGGGRMKVFDTGTYETEKWKPDEVMFTLHGSRVSGRYVLFRTGRPEPGKREDWMIRRMSPPPDGWEPIPDLIRPTRPTPTTSGLPDSDDEWAFEMRWDGTRAVAYVSGGRVRLTSISDQDISAAYPTVREIGPTLAPTEAVLDGEIVAFDRQGRVRPAPTTAAGRRPPPGLTISYLIYDLLWLEGRSTVDLPYTQRRELLDGLTLSGPAWQTPPSFVGGGEFALAAAEEQGLPGVIAKRLDAPYTPGRRTPDWLRVDTV